jgi:hypothetical protein
VGVWANSGYFTVRHYITGVYYLNGVCLLRGTKLIFEYNSGSGFFKGLMWRSVNRRQHGTFICLYFKVYVNNDEGISVNLLHFRDVIILLG